MNEERNQDDVLRRSEDYYDNEVDDNRGAQGLATLMILYVAAFCIFIVWVLARYLF